MIFNEKDADRFHPKTGRDQAVVEVSWNSRKIAKRTLRLNLMSVDRFNEGVLQHIDIRKALPNNLLLHLADLDHFSERSHPMYLTKEWPKLFDNLRQEDQLPGRF
jgi:ribosome biogenesis protein Nip4